MKDSTTAMLKLMSAVGHEVPTGEKKSRRAIALSLLLVLSMPAAVVFVGTTPIGNADHDGVVMAQSSDSEVLYSASDDGSVKALYGSNGSAIWTFNGHSAAVDGVQVSPDGEVVYSAGEDYTVRAINAGDGSQIWKFNASSQYLDAISVSQDGDVVYASTTNNELIAINASDGTEIWRNSDGGRDAIAVSPDGGVLYTASSSDNTARAIDASDGSEIWSFSGHGGSVLAIAAAPGGDVVYSGSNDDTAKALHADNGTEIWSASVSQNVYSLTASRDSVYLGTGDPSTKALFPDNGSVQWSSSDSANIYGVSLSEDRSVLYSAAGDNTVEANNADDGSKIWSASPHSNVVEDVSAGGMFATTYKDQVSVRVTDQDGDPVADARVTGVGVNYSKYDSSLSETEKDDLAIEDLQDASDVMPDQWKDRGSPKDEATVEPGTDTSYVTAYSRDTISPKGGLLWTDSASLSRPDLAFEAGEKVYFTQWNGELGGFGYNTQLPGGLEGAKDTPNVTLRRHSDDKMITVPIDQSFSDSEIVSNPLGQSTLPYGVTRLPAGYYEVFPGGGATETNTYTIKVGDPVDRINSAIRNESEESTQKYTERAQTVRSNLQNNKFKRTTAYTNSSGYATLNVTGPNVESIRIQATKVNGLDMETDIDSQASGSNVSATMENQTQLTQEAVVNETRQLYLPADPKTVTLPRNDTVAVTMQSLSWPPNANASRLDDRMEEWKQNQLDDILSSVNATWQQRLRNLRNDTLNKSEAENLTQEPMNRTEIEELHDRIENLTLQNEVLTERYKLMQKKYHAREENGTLGELNGTNTTEAGSGDTVVVNIDESNASTEQLRDRIAVMEQTISLLREDINTETDTSRNTGSETVDATFTIPGEVSEENILVTAHTGLSGTQVADEYLTIDQQGVGPTTETVVTVSDYPVNQSDESMVTFSVRAVTDDGETAKEDAHVRNPTVEAEPPAFDSVRLSDGYPAPNTKTSVEVVPGESDNFGTVESARVYYPNGTAADASVNGTQVDFATGNEGIHLVRAKMSPIGSNTTFSETVRVRVANSREQPPMIRAASGPTGSYTIVGNGLQRASIDRGGDGVDIEAFASENANPSDVHVWTSEMNLSPESDLSVSLLKSDGQTYDSNARVHIHTQSISENALVYRVADGDRQPMTRGPGTSEFGKVEMRNGGTVITTATDSSGNVKIETNNDPNIVDRMFFEARQLTTGVSLPSGLNPLQIVPVGFGMAILPIAIRRRRRST